MVHRISTKLPFKCL